MRLVASRPAPALLSYYSHKTCPNRLTVKLNCICARVCAGMRLVASRPAPALLSYYLYKRCPNGLTAKLNCVCAHVCAAMRLVASRPAPALLSSPDKRHVKEEVRHEAMSLVLAGIVATMVLATLKVTAVAFSFLLTSPSFCLLLLWPLAHGSLNKPVLYGVSVGSLHHLFSMCLIPRVRYLRSSL